MDPMKDFVVYTAARFAVFLAAFAVVWVITGFFLEINQIVTIWVLLVALIISSVISIFTLAPLRDKLAYRIQNRAEHLHERIEESKRAEDVD